MTTGISSFTKNSPLYRIALIAALFAILVLLLPLIMMQFTHEVNWSPMDFALAGILLFSAGLAFLLVLRSGKGIIQKAAVASWIGINFLMIWANLAVGLIGSGPNIANILYIVVIAVAIAGAYITKFRPGGMLITTLFTVSVHFIIVAFALITGMHHLPGITIFEILAVNGFFVMLWLISGLLFQVADPKRR
jgi:hypothetical protein